MNIKETLKEYDERIKELGGCGDHSCRIAKPEGMGTNGGCRCVKDQLKMQKFIVFSLKFRDSINAADKV